MIHTGAQYRDGPRDGREVSIAGERVEDVNAHPALWPMVGICDGPQQWPEKFYSPSTSRVGLTSSAMDKVTWSLWSNHASSSKQQAASSKQQDEA
jgi:hypothetical protein